MNHAPSRVYLATGVTASDYPTQLNTPSLPSTPDSPPGDESTHQIPSNGLILLTFYHFPYTADPLTFTMPTQPSPTIAWTFAWSPPTMPYTHRTISLVPHWRPPIWPTNHVVIFPFLSLFSFTQCILLWPDQSQVIAQSSHHAVGTLPYVLLHMNLVLILLIICI